MKKFRKDINGLRAIAVIAVVLFHFQPSSLPGGFAGVDVFFVISGFLMTGIIFRGIEQDKFSIAQFYVARANRIVPALFVLCVALLAFGWFFLIPGDYKALGKHVGSSLGFVSNFVYLRESGYFDSSSHEKWLLHTWSLSTEWQFYLIYPILLVISSKFLSLKHLRSLVLIATACSFFFCVFSTYKSPNSAYYLLPSRAWEMLLGGVAFLYPMSIRENNKRYLEWFSLALILGSYLCVSKDTPWPGYLALFPVIGSFFIIQAQRNNSFITGNVVFQKIGTWSYSIYLWHWPLVVIIYYFSLDGAFIYLGVVASIFLGFLSSTYIEKIGFRIKFNHMTDYLKCKSLYMVLLVGTLGSIVFVKDGFVERLSLTEQRILYFKDTLLDNFNNAGLTKACDVRELEADKKCLRLTGIDQVPAAIILGDSHTVAISPGVYESLLNSGKEGNIINAGAYGCIPIKGFNHKVKTRQGCKDYSSYIYDKIQTSFESVPIIILSRFNLYPLGFNEGGEISTPYMYINEKEFNYKYKEEFMQAFVNSMCELSRSNTVYVLKPVLEFGFSIPSRMLKNSFLGLNEPMSISHSEYELRNKFISRVLKEAETQCSIKVLDSSEKFYSNGRYFGEVSGLPLYSDDNHLNVFGARHVSQVFDVIWQ